MNYVHDQGLNDLLDIDYVPFSNQLANRLTLTKYLSLTRFSYLWIRLGLISLPTCLKGDVNETYSFVLIFWLITLHLRSDIIPKGSIPNDWAIITDHKWSLLKILSTCIFLIAEIAL